MTGPALGRAPAFQFKVEGEAQDFLSQEMGITHVIQGMSYEHKIVRELLQRQDAGRP